MSRDRYPSLALADSDRMFEWSKRLVRESAGSGEAIAFKQMAFEIDVRALSGSVHLPTLVLHREGYRICHVAEPVPKRTLKTEDVPEEIYEFAMDSHWGRSVVARRRTRG